MHAPARGTLNPMAQHSRFPASAPPTAPERETTGRLLLRAWIIIVLLCAFGHAAVFNLVGMTGAVVTLAAVTATTLAIWIPAIARARPWPLDWRRLPWAILGYVALAFVSVLWSRWPAATALTGALLASLTMHALFIGHMLSWREILRALASALKWLIGLSLAIELWVAAVLQHPILPNFFEAPDGQINPHWYWVRGNLLGDGRIQGIVGNANILAALCLVAVIVFAVLMASGARWRVTLALWIALSAYLMIRASSATMFAAAVAALVTLVVALLVRRAAPARRTGLYVVALAGSAMLVVAAVLLRGPLLDLVGRTTDMTGRFRIWQTVLARAAERPLFGNGFSSPWVPSEAEIDGWLVDHGITVFHAHNMWIDVFFQLGAVGVVLMGFIVATLLWRAWFFAVDRPRWDLRADRPYSPLTLAPSLIGVVLLVQGLAESAPIMLWGWLLIVLFSAKIKAVPLLGRGLSERARIIERGETPKRVP